MIDYKYEAIIISTYKPILNTPRIEHTQSSKTNLISPTALPAEVFVVH